MKLYDGQHESTDAGVSAFDHSDVVDTSDGSVTFDWDAIPIVEVDGPVADAFETNQFYRIDATIARPIPQPYQYNDSIVWLKKPREELQKAAWSVENSYWTHNHPSSDNGMVRDVSQVRGFWKHPRYDTKHDNLDADLHVPVGDEDSRQFLEENGDVSIGFRHKNTRVDAYDGTVGGADSEEIELTGYQTDILVNHVASVQTGRCSAKNGCGVNAPSTDSNGTHGHTAPCDGNASIDASDSHDTDYQIDGFIRGIQITYDYEDDGQYYAVAPDENPDDEPKYPINSCSDVEDAWKLRNHGDISIEVSTLESRIKNRAQELGCDVPESDDNSTDKNMTECTDCGDDGITIDASDMSLDYLVDEHDGVADAVEQAEQYEEISEDVDDVLDHLGVDSIDSAIDAIEMKEQRLDELDERVTEIDRDEAEEHAEFIREHYDNYDERWGDLDELVESGDVETLADRRGLVEEFVDTESTETTTANPSNDSNPTVSGPQRSAPWE